MFSLATLALLAASAHALVVPRSTPPPTYAVGYLEDYTTYHIRYLALNCHLQHNTQFFDDCCHPMLANENLKDDRKAVCTPSTKASASASAVEPTSTIKPDEDDDGCIDDDDESPETDSPHALAPKKDDKPAPPKNVAPAPPPADKPDPAPKPPASDLGGLSGLGKIFSGGIATFFFQNGVAGACGTVHKDTDFVVALQTQTYAGGKHCGKKVRLQNAKTGHTETAVVADECPTCNNPQSVDMSHALFNSFASDGEGIFDLKWGFE